MDDLVTVMSYIGLVGVFAVGGSLFAFSTFVMSALGRLPDADGIRAMQHVNQTVFTPWFMIPFFGTAVLSVAAVIIAVASTDEPWWIPLLCSGALYGLGVFVVTAAGNVPLNNRLASVNAAEAPAEVFWRRYLSIWTRWNHVRVAASISSVLCFATTVRMAAIAA